MDLQRVYVYGSRLRYRHDCDVLPIILVTDPRAGHVPDRPLSEVAGRLVLDYRVDIGHTITEHRRGLVVDAELAIVSGTAEREAASTMLARRRASNSPCTLGAGRQGPRHLAFVRTCRDQRVTPHIATKRTGSALDQRTIITVGEVSAAIGQGALTRLG